MKNFPRPLDLSVIESRPLPSSDECERTVLGSVLIDAESSLPVVADVTRGRQVFFRAQNNRIWEAILALSKRGIVPDLVTVKDELKTREPDFDWGYLASLVDGVPDIARVSSYAKTLVRKAVQREAIYQLHEAQERIHKDEIPSISDIMDVHGELTRSVTGEEDETIDGAGLARLALFDYENLNYDEMLVNSGFSRLDSLTYGMERGTLTVVGAKAGTGKTLYALNATINILNRDSGGQVVFFSLEMPTRLMYERILAAKAQVWLRSIKFRSLSKGDLEKFTRAAAWLGGKTNFKLISSTSSLDDIISEALRAHKKGPVDLVVVDFAQKIENNKGGDQRHLNLEKTCYALLDLAKKIDAPVLLLSQLNKAKDYFGEHGEPTMDLLAESSGLQRAPRTVAIMTDTKRGPCARDMYVLKASESGGAGNIVEMHVNGDKMILEEGNCNERCKFWTGPREASGPDQGEDQKQDERTAGLWDDEQGAVEGPVGGRQAG